MSFMLSEAREAGNAVRRLLDRQDLILAEAGRILRETGGTVTTAARGSSDHAVTAFKYACEIGLGRPIASIGPSIASVYDAPLRLQDGLHITVSQSGGSPDILSLQQCAARGGARTIAVVNVENSPLADDADMVVPIEAGEEKSVAATKSFIASAAALFAIVGHASANASLLEAIQRLPDVLDSLETVSLSALSDALTATDACFVTGRGAVFGVALEAALKAKETAGIHAEAFSAAELMHGPLQLVQADFPVFVFVSDDASRDSTLAAIARLESLGARVLPMFTTATGSGLQLPTTCNAIVDGLVFVCAWYRAVEAASRRLGRDPDRPNNLRKVTRTV